MNELRIDTSAYLGTVATGDRERANRTASPAFRISASDVAESSYLVPAETAITSSVFTLAPVDVTLSRSFVQRAVRAYAAAQDEADGDKTAPARTPAALQSDIVIAQAAVMRPLLSAISAYSAPSAPSAISASSAVSASANLRAYGTQGLSAHGGNGVVAPDDAD